MPIVIRDATVVTSNAARTVHHDASIAVDADRIVAIGPTEEIDRGYPSVERVDGRGKAVFPGLVNCHTHLWLTVARGILEDFGVPVHAALPDDGAGDAEPRGERGVGVDPQRPGGGR